jgi:hypothetical protein
MRHLATGLKARDWRAYETSDEAIRHQIRGAKLKRFQVADVPGAHGWTGPTCTATPSAWGRRPASRMPSTSVESWLTTAGVVTHLNSACEWNSLADRRRSDTGRGAADRACRYQRSDRYRGLP